MSKKPKETEGYLKYAALLESREEGDGLDPDRLPEYSGLDLSEGGTKFFLENVCGLRAVRIDGHRCADFRVDGDGAGYVVEVATRFTEIEGSELGKTVDTSRDPKVMEWLKAARIQCGNVDPQHERLWLLSCFPGGPFGEQAQVDRIEAALYGKREGFDFTDAQPETINVYYARRGLFEDHIDIDGALVFLGEGVGIMPNEDSPRLDRLMNSTLAAKVGQKKSWPAARGLCVPRTMDRTNQADVLRYVQRTLQKSHFNFMASENYWYAFTRIPKEHLQGG